MATYSNTLTWKIPWTEVMILCISIHSIIKAMLRVIYNCYPHFTTEELKDKQKCPEAKLESVRFGIYIWTVLPQSLCLM